MTLRNAIAAELRKLLALPSALLALALSALSTLGFAAMSANSMRNKLDLGDPTALTHTSTMEVGFNLIPVGTIGAIVLGVVIVSSEYAPNSKDAGGGRQILTSLTCTPRRGMLLAAKTIVLILVTGALSAVTISVTIALSQVLLGAHGNPPGEVLTALGWRAAGGVAYWVLIGVIAFAVTVMTRSGIVPLIAFIANTTLVSVTFLLTRLTPLANYLPDVAGAAMIGVFMPREGMLDPLPGGLVMTAWAAGLLAVAARLFVRRDA
ncbi:ABC transporter permease [Actinomadura sp. ATCC 31491]|uniref:ABC transporter permease n=1 Tax=Actinomadura luzonensis TaxID=2805427 RepID=A0ABT0FLT7_9ACTN|nr:ABC transporter permease [Actinomadura luzonensis]MCK2213294.1 ABC transporter permease [Actinomadura luzonensis]